MCRKTERIKGMAYGEIKALFVLQTDNVLSALIMSGQHPTTRMELGSTTVRRLRYLKNR